MITAATLAGRARAEAAPSISMLPGVGLQRLEQQRAVGRVEEVDAADRDRADRVAVVGVLQRDEARAARLAGLLEVLVGDLQGDLGGGRAAVRIEDARQVARARSRSGARPSGSPARARGRASSSARRGRAGRGSPGRSSGAGVRGRCTRARRRRRCTRCPSMSISVQPWASAMIGASSASQPCCWVKGCQR